MSWQNILDFVTQLLNGEVLGSSDFNRLLLHAQRKYENRREWMMLKRFDTSQTYKASDTYQTAKTIPADFANYLADKPVVLVDSAGNETQLFQIPIEAIQTYYNMFGYFAVDFYNNSLYIMGSATQTYTIRQNYQAMPSVITSGPPAVTWIFPVRFHSILAYDIAVNYKTGIDYDSVNAMQAQGNQQQIQEIWEDMLMWDSKLQVDSLKGMDRSVGGGRFQTGTINMNR